MTDDLHGLVHNRFGCISLQQAATFGEILIGRTPAAIDESAFELFDQSRGGAGEAVDMRHSPRDLGLHGQPSTSSPSQLAIGPSCL